MGGKQGPITAPLETAAYGKEVDITRQSAWLLEKEAHFLNWLWLTPARNGGTSKGNQCLNRWTSEAFFESGEDFVDVGRGGGSGPASPEQWAPSVVRLPRPDGRESRSTPAQASWLWELPHCTPNSWAVTRSGIPKSSRLLGIFIPHLVRYFFRKNVWVKGGSWEEWSRQAALSLRFWRPTAAVFGGLSQSA